MTKQTTPLAKSYTTLEGQLVTVLIILCAVAAKLDPSQFPPKWAGAISAAATIALVLQRLLIKRAALQAPAPAVSVLPPVQMTSSGTTSQVTVTKTPAPAVDKEGWPV